MIHHPGVFQVTLKLCLLGPRGLLILKDRASGEGDLPGGRINEDELYQPFSQSLAREVQEELGPIAYRLLPDPLFGFGHFIEKDQARALGLLFLGHYISGSIELSQEHDEFQWVDTETYKPEEHFRNHLLSAVARFLKGINHTSNPGPEAGPPSPTGNAFARNWSPADPITLP